MGNASVSLMAVNAEELLCSGDRQAKEIALKLAQRAIEESNPYNAVRKWLSFERGELRVGGHRFPLRGDLYLLALGKAACLMAKRAEELLGERLKEGLAVTKYGYSLPLKRTAVIEAGHPVPDENSLQAAHQGVELALKLRPEDMLLFLISGGGSALFTYPQNGLTLRDKIEVNDLLLRSGARIQEINAVRKHLSKVKGGNLARLVKGTLIALVLSDVVGDSLEAIASGPTAKDPTTFQDAQRILRLYNLWDKLPGRVRDYLALGLEGKAEETLKQDLPHVHNYLIGGVGIACKAVREEAGRLGLESHILTTTLEGEAKEVALALGSIVAEVYRKGRPLPKPGVLIAGGETTVTLSSGTGRGGPNQEFALSIARKIHGLKGVAVLAMDTDGTDGPTEAAGGLVDSFTSSLLEEGGIRVEECLAQHNTYEALKKAKALLVTGPTGTNVNSLYIAVIL